MKIYIPHPFKTKDNLFHFSIGARCIFTPWYRKFQDEDIYEVYDLDVYHNYAGWLWFVVNWYTAD